MNTPKASTLARPVILIILVALLTCVIGIAVGGWSTTEEIEPDKADTQNESLDKEKPKEQQDNQETNLSYDLDYLTGLPIAKEEASAVPMAFLFDSDYPLYGISYSYLTVEFPMEKGKTRILSYIRETDKLGKIGAIAKTRPSITDIADIFGGILLYAGDDSIVSTEKETQNIQKINLSAKGGYSYTENEKEVYTTPYLIQTAIRDFALITSFQTTPTLPFQFSKDMQIPSASAPAKTVTLPFSADHTSVFQYQEAERAYTWLKNGTPVTDPLSYGDITYENVIILFADATTYETMDYTQTVMNTTESGTGYYLTNGTYERISFSKDESEQMFFYDTFGRQLTVNPGKTYIGYFKSSMKSTVKIG